MSNTPVPPTSFMAKLRLPRAIGWRDHVIGALLAAAYVVLLLSTARSLGFARDEGFYFSAATRYASWFQMLAERPHDAMQRAAIDAVWSTNHEHPALMKSLFAFSWMLFHEKWRLFADASTAFRFPGMLMAGGALWITYIFGARVFSRRAGAIAAVLLAMMPRVFYHSHLAAFDIGITTMWTLSIYVYWRSVEHRTLPWAIACGVVYGLTLETKHNAWILPLVFGIHALFTDGRRFARNLAVGRVSIPANLVAIFTIGPAVFVALWPWMWSDTIPRVQEWFDFHLHHTYYNMEFLGRNYFDAPSPRSYAPLMILATVPAVTLVLAFFGCADRLRRVAIHAFVWTRAFVKGERTPIALRDPKQTDILLLLAFAAPIAPFVLLSTTPIFGGTKHWLTAYPFLAMFAGRGFDLASDAMNRALPGVSRGRAILFHATLAITVIVAPLAETLHSHPFGLSSYVATVGGTAGGADLGLNRQFWGFTTESVAPFLDREAPRGASVFIHDTAWDSWARLQDEGRIRRDLRAVGNPSDAMFSIVHHELHMNEVDDQIWVAYGKRAPAYVLTHDGVPIVSVYKR